jgi:hypothetical protein
MTDSRAALGSDRLPWLSDEPTAQPKRSPRKPKLSPLLAPAAGALLLVAGASYWLGTRTGGEGQAETSHVSRTLVTPLPRPTIAPPRQEVEITPERQVNPAPVREVRSTAQREVPIERPRAVKRVVVQNPEAPSETPESSSIAPAPAARPATNPDARPLKAWPAGQSAGAKGRIVRIGAFGTRDQAKLGWRYMVRAYPAVAHLKATVVADHNSRGRRFYRFQIGTTSQAHSEVLCQRMERIRFSCAVVGLPWKPKGVER